MTYSAHGLEVRWRLVFEEIRVGNLAWRPHALVGRVIDHLRCPFAFVVWVLLHRLLPRPTAGHLITLGVRNHGWDPVAVLLVIPVFGLLGFGVRNHGWFILEPIGGFLGFLVDDLVGSIFIPVIWLRSVWVRNASLVDPVVRLAVFGIIDLLLRVDGWVEVFEKRASFADFAIDADFVFLIRVNNEGVESCSLSDTGTRRGFEVLLLILAGLGVLVAEDKVDFVRRAALVRPEHDDIRARVGELVGLKLLVVLEELHIGATALQAALKLDLILNDKSIALVRDWRVEFGGDGVVSGLVFENKTLITIHATKDSGLLDTPGADVLPLLLRILLLGVRGLPS